MDAKNHFLQENMVVSEVLATGSNAMQFFMGRKLDCVGCRMACFCTLAEVAKNYELPLEQFLVDLGKAMQGEDC